MQDQSINPRATEEARIWIGVGNLREERRF
jgi:hypothetical protein